MDYNYVSNIFLENIDLDYLKFSKKLLPNIDNILGIRMPILRKLAKEIASGDYMAFIKTNKNIYFEDIMLEGLVIGYLDKDLNLVIDLVKNFIPKIYNWSICDSFANNLKIVKKNKAYFWNFIKPYFHSRETYPTRFALVVFLTYYIEEEYLGDFFQIIRSIKTEDYYVEMAIAWAVSSSYINFPYETYKFLEKKPLSKSITNKTIQKIRDSRQVSFTNKDLVLGLKIK